MPNQVSLQFLGAARTVTGSKYLIEYGDKKVLVDCGLFQGKKELRNRNWESFPVPASDINAIVLTHAHLDHTGYLPRIVKQGFTGPIYCTEPTAELTKYILLDSAHLQEEEANHANKYKTSKHNPAQPLYTTEDAEAALALLKIIPRDKYSTVLQDFEVLPKVAGHILGACSLTFKVGSKVINFSGDIGRYDVPLLPDPAPIDFGDLLLCESTYGDRLHASSDPESELEKIILETAHKSGPLLIPSFAIGRCQALLYTIRKLEDEGRIPVLPTFIDSPMAISATSIYKKFHYDFDDEAQRISNHKKDIIESQKTFFLRSVEDSKKLNQMKGPFTVIAGSGMATGGRILHHFKRWLSDSGTTVLFVGFQAEETRGARLLAGEKTLRLYGEDIPVKAQIRSLSGLSAHGDRNELSKWLSSCKGTPEKVKIVHGEPKTTEIFSKYLSEKFKWNVSPAEHLEKIIV